jgi:putative PIN family toxin of toxin-antitoxin system
MRILLDTNVVFSSLLWDGNEHALVETIIVQRHTIVMTDLIMEEVRRTVTQKTKPRITKKIFALIDRLEASPYVLIKTAREYHAHTTAALDMINKKDAPILAAAMLADVDVIVSGDNGFIKNPKLKKWRGKKLFTTKELLLKLGRSRLE